MKSTLIRFLFSVGIAASAHATYQIGQTEIPNVVVHDEPADFQVHEGHPRLFFRGSDLPAIRARIAGDYRAEWREMLDQIEQEALRQPAAKLAQGPHLKLWSGRNVVFAAVVTGDRKYLAWAKAWAEALAAAGPVGNDNEYRGRLQCLAIAYDWLYPVLSNAERQRLREAIVAHIDRNWYFASGATNYIGGHSRWGNFALAAGLLAVVSERPDLRDKLLVVRNHWLNGYFPAQAWIANEGGYHMGWAYSAAYLTGGINLVWSVATNETVFFPWLGKLPRFWIYGRQGDGFYPNTGDAYTVQDDLNAYHRDLLMIASGVLKDPYAAWTIRRHPDRFADILFGDKRVTPRAPDDPQAPLPLSKNFGNAGVVVARDRWDEATTLLQFRSVPFYSANHHHRDENSFTLHYRGGLAIDSGLYDEGGTQKGGYGGPHWRNYFTRTIAHNAIVVFDPDQKMTVLGEPASNDGGQTYREEPTKLEDLQPGGQAHLDGITRFVDTADYTYASGDATKAYDPARVNLAQRDIVYLRGAGRAHPVVVVFDRVESAKPDFQKKFLLHTVNEPSGHGSVTVAEHKGGRLTCVTLLPEQAKLNLVGGPGKEAWVDGENHPWDPTHRVRPGREGGAWRLEVSPSAPANRDYFLHVLFVDDAGAAPVAAEDAKLTRDEGRVGVNVAGWKIEFPLAAGGAARIERAP
ncbi:MAG TPA: heparinase II/III family protein [Opitutus sp.]|nr:heparinase II/III family protein [Opitutus sp.]